MPIAAVTPMCDKKLDAAAAEDLRELLKSDNGNVCVMESQREKMRMILCNYSKLSLLTAP